MSINQLINPSPSDLSNELRSPDENHTAEQFPKPCDRLPMPYLENVTSNEKGLHCFSGKFYSTSSEMSENENENVQSFDNYQISQKFVPYSDFMNNTQNCLDPPVIRIIQNSSSDSSCTKYNIPSPFDVCSEKGSKSEAFNSYFGELVFPSFPDDLWSKQNDYIPSNEKYSISNQWFASGKEVLPCLKKMPKMRPSSKSILSFKNSGMEPSPIASMINDSNGSSSSEEPINNTIIVHKTEDLAESDRTNFDENASNVTEFLSKHIDGYTEKEEKQQHYVRNPSPIIIKDSINIGSNYRVDHARLHKKTSFTIISEKSPQSSRIQSPLTHNKKTEPITLKNIIKQETKTLPTHQQDIQFIDSENNTSNIFNEFQRHSVQFDMNLLAPASLNSTETTMSNLNKQKKSFSFESIDIKELPLIPPGIVPRPIKPNQNPTRKQRGLLRIFQLNELNKANLTVPPANSYDDSVIEYSNKSPQFSRKKHRRRSSSTPIERRNSTITASQFIKQNYRRRSSSTSPERKSSTITASDRRSSNLSTITTSDFCFYKPRGLKQSTSKYLMNISKVNSSKKSNEKVSIARQKISRPSKLSPIIGTPNKESKQLQLFSIKQRANTTKNNTENRRSSLSRIPVRRSSLGSIYSSIICTPPKNKSKSEILLTNYEKLPSRSTSRATSHSSKNPRLRSVSRSSSRPKSWNKNSIPLNVSIKSPTKSAGSRTVSAKEKDSFRTGTRTDLNNISRTNSRLDDFFSSNSKAISIHSKTRQQSINVNEKKSSPFNPIKETSTTPKKSKSSAQSPLKKIKSKKNKTFFKNKLTLNKESTSQIPIIKKEKKSVSDSLIKSKERNSEIVRKQQSKKEKKSTDSKAPPGPNTSLSVRKSNTDNKVSRLAKVKNIVSSKRQNIKSQKTAKKGETLKKVKQSDAKLTESKEALDVSKTVPAPTKDSNHNSDKPKKDATDNPAEQVKEKPSNVTPVREKVPVPGTKKISSNVSLLRMGSRLSLYAKNRPNSSLGKNNITDILHENDQNISEKSVVEESKSGADSLMDKNLSNKDETEEKNIIFESQKNSKHEGNDHAVDDVAQTRSFTPKISSASDIEAQNDTNNLRAENSSKDVSIEPPKPKTNSSVVVKNGLLDTQIIETERVSSQSISFLPEADCESENFQSINSIEESRLETTVPAEDSAKDFQNISKRRSPDGQGECNESKFEESESQEYLEERHDAKSKHCSNCFGKLCMPCIKKKRKNVQNELIDKTNKTALSASSSTTTTNLAIIEEVNKSKKSCWSRICCGSKCTKKAKTNEADKPILSSPTATEQQGPSRNSNCCRGFWRIICCKTINKVEPNVESDKGCKKFCCCIPCCKKSTVKTGSIVWQDLESGLPEDAEPKRSLCNRILDKCLCCRTRKVTNKSRRQSIRAPPQSEADVRKKLHADLVEYTSKMKAAIPVLPLLLAWFCAICNILIPGLGTLLSGLFCICIGIPRFSQFDSFKARCGSLIINIIVAISQLFCVLFCFVGWGWSIWWGTIMLKCAKKLSKIRKVEKLEMEEEKRQAQIAATATRGALNVEHEHANK